MFVDGPVLDASDGGGSAFVLDDGFSILFDCDYDVIGAWSVLNFDLDQMLHSQCKLATTTLVDDTYFDNISLLKDYRQIH